MRFNSRSYNASRFGSLTTSRDILQQEMGRCHIQHYQTHSQVVVTFRYREHAVVERRAHQQAVEGHSQMDTAKEHKLVMEGNALERHRNEDRHLLLQRKTVSMGLALTQTQTYHRAIIRLSRKSYSSSYQQQEARDKIEEPGLKLHALRHKLAVPSSDHRRRSLFRFQSCDKQESASRRLSHPTRSHHVNVQSFG